MYHRVADLAPDSHRLCISPVVFRAHIAELKRRCHLMPLTELASALEHGTLPPRAAAVTLDDGCIDNLTTASAILVEFEAPATFFIPTDRLDEKHEFWWDVLERIFMASRVLPPVLELPGSGVTLFPTAIADERAATHRALAEYLRSLRWEVRDALLRSIVDWSGVDVTPRETHRPMLASEVRELGARKGHAIGAHSVHHVGLPILSREEKRRELVESKKTLEELLATIVTAFAYPYGHVDAETVGVTSDVFHVAVTAAAAPAGARDDSRTLPRFDGNRLTPDELVELVDSLWA
jgi:peptidoglycan/xylan/chitin deacetylase (PgdA/CDA1 family)